jgi:RNA polymerase sigma-70 factor (ECF subfamily)
MTSELPLEQLYRRYGPMVYRRCRQLLRDEQEALDAQQDVFLNVTRHRHRLNDRAPSSLLNRIATHVCLNRLRDPRGEPAPLDETLLTIARTEDPESRSLAGRILARLFERELPSTRTIAVLHYVDGMTLEEVAQEVGLSLSGVRKRLRTFQGRLPPPEIP